MVGPDRDGTFEEVEKLAKTLKVQSHVVFKGKLKQEDWWELSKEYDIFINTTNFDNTPVSVMESMALGLPVVSTNVGGIPYLLDNNNDAILVKKNDINSMSEAIKNLIEDNELSSKICLNARKKVEQLDWNVVKEQWINLLNEDKNVK